MPEFAPLFVLVLIWFLIGYPLSRISKAAKSRGASKSAPRPRVPMPDEPESVSLPPEPETIAPDARMERPPMVPTISVTDRGTEVYQGSMNALTGEGDDPCHEEDLQGLNAAETSSLQVVQESHALPFGWTGDDMVRGIVVSEILKRK